MSTAPKRRRSILNAIKAAFSTVSLPKAWPNIVFDPTKTGNLPYVAVTIIRADTIDNTVAGEMPIDIGRIIATVVVAGNTSDGTADDHADAIASLFPKGQILTGGGYTVEITGPPHIREGMPDNGYWRVPVSIPFRAY